MKTLLPIIAFLVLSFASAQEPLEKLVIEKGTWNIRGSASIRFSNNENGLNLQDIVAENSLNSFSIAPSFGYTLKNNLIVGVGLQYYNQKNEGSTIGLNNNDTFKTTSNSIGLAPYVRGYKGIGKQLALYLQGEVGYNHFWDTNVQDGQNENNDSTGNNLFVGVRPGITYFLGQKLAIEASYGSLGYSYTERKNDNGTYSKNNSFNLNLNTSDLLFGIAYYF